MTSRKEKFKINSVDPENMPKIIHIFLAIMKGNIVLRPSRNNNISSSVNLEREQIFFEYGPEV